MRFENFFYCVRLESCGVCRTRRGFLAEVAWCTGVLSARVQSRRRLAMPVCIQNRARALNCSVRAASETGYVDFGVQWSCHGHAI
ncbi:hypothetical protein METSCH_C05890 [Metschnikowia aff. pulcherrima]|uniref:Uncharacterized protein n=1 Tax=Metschnikowia aff. pulcherrima TaxID=2163413 RepID=A0A4V1AEB3_9ASCO|nr:hypothetical protein METSCH_C05890 [Metschnikowia aff. pulcherrima]